MKKLQLLKNNQDRDWTDLAWVDEFNDFLQGKMPDGITMPDPPNLTEKQAFSVIWYLQEHFCLIPDNIERCVDCGVFFDSNGEGDYDEELGNFCDNCYSQAIFDGKIKEGND